MIDVQKDSKTSRAVRKGPGEVEAPTQKAVELPRTRQTRLFLRGTDLMPTGEKLKSCLAGSKQSILVDMLKRPGGATMDELIEALAGGRRAWTEATVRSGFGWDLKNKGYGVRSEFDTYGVERFHLVVPNGQLVPEHAKKRTHKRRK